MSKTVRRMSKTVRRMSKTVRRGLDASAEGQGLDATEDSMRVRRT
jgi:hypothetical protein